MINVAKEWAKDFYNSKEWDKVRELKMQQQYGLCERCGDIAKIVHHKIYLTPYNINDTNISLNLDNLECLCLICHNKEHGYFNANEDDDDYEYEFDEHGNIVAKQPRPI